MIFLLVTLAVSIFLNVAFVYRFINANGEFWLDDRNPDNIKPVLKMDLDEWEGLNYIVIRYVHNKDSGDKERK